LQAAASRKNTEKLMSSSFNEISRDDLKRGLADGSILLVDVREADEYTAGHIKGALFNPLSKIRSIETARRSGGQESRDLLPFRPPLGERHGAGAARGTTRRQHAFWRRHSRLAQRAAACRNGGVKLGAIGSSHKALA
jgi:hypothetical protein